MLENHIEPPLEDIIYYLECLLQEVNIFRDVCKNKKIGKEPSVDDYRLYLIVKLEQYKLKKINRDGLQKSQEIPFPVEA